MCLAVATYYFLSLWSNVPTKAVNSYGGAIVADIMQQ